MEKIESQLSAHQVRGSSGERKAKVRWSSVLPLLGLLLLLLLLPGLAGASNHAFTITSPAANTVWTAGAVLPIQWTGPSWVTSVNIVLGDVPSWTTYTTIATGVPNNGSYTWTLPANLPPSTYLIYIEDVDRRTWGYGDSFLVIKEEEKGYDLTVAKKPGEVLVAGQQGSYEIYASNLGPGTAPGPVTVTDFLDPATLSFVSAVGTGWTCSFAGSTLTCIHPGPVAANTALPPITLAVMVAEDAKEVRNCAIVGTRGADGDLNPENDRDCVLSVVEAPIGLICGIKFNDANGNGLQDAGEAGLANWTIELYDANGLLVATVLTDSSGRYCFKEVKPGTYTVSELQQAGWSQTYPAAPSTHTVTLAPPKMDAGGLLLFGNTKLTGSICGAKFHDRNGNGKWDPSEAGLSGWTVGLYDASGALIATGVTGSDGQFCFKDLPLGSYTLVEVNQPGWTQTLPVAPLQHQPDCRAAASECLSLR